jgi:hypothetical protein
MVGASSIMASMRPSVVAWTLIFMIAPWGAIAVAGAP